MTEIEKEPPDDAESSDADDEEEDENARADTERMSTDDVNRMLSHEDAVPSDEGDDEDIDA